MKLLNIIQKTYFSDNYMIKDRVHKIPISYTYFLCLLMYVDAKTGNSCFLLRLLRTPYFSIESHETVTKQITSLNGTFE